MSRDHNEPNRQTVRFHYVKGTNFRVVNVDGVIGGVTPSEGIHFATFTERPAFPQQEEFVLNPDGSLGEQLPEGRRSKEGIVREMDIDLVMSLEVARALRTWLDGKIKLLDRRGASTSEDLQS